MTNRKFLQVEFGVHSLTYHIVSFFPLVTVQCTKDGQFIVVVAKDVTLPHIDLETISLWGGGPGCTHVDSNSIFAIYFFPVTACGTVVMVKSKFKNCFNLGNNLVIFQ